MQALAFAHPVDDLNWDGSEKDTAYKNEIAALRTMATDLDRSFPETGDYLLKRAAVIWTAARACRFDLPALKSKFPLISQFGGGLLMADQDGDSARVLMQSRASGGEQEGLLHLLHGEGDTPQITTFSSLVNPGDWRDLDLEGREPFAFGQFKLVKQEGKLLALAQHYYHPFPKDETWPKWQMWVEISKDKLIPLRIEHYELPAKENEVKPTYLRQTYVPK